MPDLRGADMRCLHAPRRDTRVWIEEQIASMRDFVEVLRTLLNGYSMSNDLGGTDSQQMCEDYEVL
jgi:hypothetical protein